MSQWERWVFRALANGPASTGEIFAFVQCNVSFRFQRPVSVRAAIGAACERLRDQGVLERHQSARNGVHRWELVRAMAA